MTEGEVFLFADIFRGLQRVFPLRGEEHDIQSVMGSYFKVLRRYPLGMVTAGAETCLQRHKHFPKPAEWIDALPRKSAPTAEIDVMSEGDAIAYVRAEARKYDGDPCGCHACVGAGVSDRPLRFVPEQLADGRDRQMRDPKNDRLLTAGHWAHGEELRRWYEARANFWNEMLEKFPGLLSGTSGDVGRTIARVLNPRDRMSRLGA